MDKHGSSSEADLWNWLQVFHSWTMPSEFRLRMPGTYFSPLCLLPPSFSLPVPSSSDSYPLSFSDLTGIGTPERWEDGRKQVGWDRSWNDKIAQPRGLEKSSMISKLRPQRGVSQVGLRQSEERTKLGNILCATLKSWQSNFETIAAW